MDANKWTLRGRETIAGLARLYPQLYLRPGDAGAEAYRDVVLCGQDAPSESLSHFIGSDRDSCLLEETPVGAIPVITLHERADFELFLQIMLHRCSPVPIPRTQGAVFVDGVVNWTWIRAHEEEYLCTHGPDADWEREFSRFTADRANYTDALIVLSDGPYSALSADKTGLPEKDWLEASHTIRKVHECTHFLCHKLFPEKEDAVWDELVADAVGMTAALGHFDPALEERFLGIKGENCSGGRLENYLDETQDGQEQKKELIGRIRRTLSRFENIIPFFRGENPYELAIRLEEEIECWKQP